MSLTFQAPGEAVAQTATERFAEAEKHEDRQVRWAAQAGIALDSGDMYLVGLVLFKAIQEYGMEAFADLSGQAPGRLQRLWMPGVLVSVNEASQLFGLLGVHVALDRFYAARLAASQPAESVH